MSYRMARLAARFASGIGGGGTTTTEGNIPDELKPLIEGSVNRMLGLQDYFWGGGGGSNPGGYNPNTQGGNQTGGWGYNGDSLNHGAPPPTSGGGAVPKSGSGGAPAPAVGNEIYGVPLDPATGLPTEIPSGGFVPPGETPWSQAGQESQSKAASNNKGPYQDKNAPYNQEPGDGGGGGGGGGDYPWTDKEPPGGGGGGGGGGAGGGGGVGGSTSGGYGLDIAGSHPREVAGASDLQKWAGNRVTDLYGKTEGEFRAADSMRRATNAAAMNTASDYSQDPGVMEAIKAFNTFEAPMINDRDSLTGNARGSANRNNLSMGLASMMLPQINAAQQRDENRINRITGTALETGKGWQSIGAQDWQRRSGALDKAMGVGGEMRDQAQEGMDSEYEDFLRRAALGENALMGPFGGLVPSTIGSTTRSKK